MPDFGKHFKKPLEPNQILEDLLKSCALEFQEKLGVDLPFM